MANTNRTKRPTRKIGANKKGSSTSLAIAIVATSLAFVSLNLWQSERILQNCAPAASAPAPGDAAPGAAGAADGLGPELARLLHPLYKVMLRDHAFFMTGHGGGEYVSDSYLSQGVLYEASVTEKLLSYQKRFGGDVLDVGMNVGTVSVPVAHFCGGCQVIGIEAVPANFRKAEANARLNGLANLRQLNVALQDRPNVTSLAFETFQGNMAMGRMAGTGGPRKEQADAAQVRVAATTLDALRGQLRHVRVVKVDVEGAELLAMRGALQWLAETPPCVIVMEVDKIDAKAMAVLLAGRGFAMHDAKEEGIRTKSANAVFKHNGEGCHPPPPKARTIWSQTSVVRGGKLISMGEKVFKK